MSSCSAVSTPFGGRLHAQLVRQLDRRLDDRQRVGRADQVGDEAAVDLDLGERERAQVAEARIAGAEIVHRDPHAQRGEPLEQRAHPGLVVEQHRFGDLQLEPLRLEPGHGQRRDRHRDKVAALHLRGRKVDRDLDPVRPACRIAAGLAQHPFADRDDQARFLGDRDELGRQQQPASRVLPAD
jgi:hypothetical protein